MKRTLQKYGEVALVNLRARFAYLWDQILGSLFLVVIMFVYVQLWRVTYAGAADQQAFAGYTLAEMIWYLVAAESIVLSLPRIHATLESEVKEGDLAIRLNKPYNYLLFHYASFLGEGLMRLATHLITGGLTAYLLVGGFPFRWMTIPLLLGVYLTTQALHFCYNASIGLAAFWFEDVFGLFIVFDRIKWVLGGFFLPIAVYPTAVRRLVEVLPFRRMIADPATLFVRFDGHAALQLLGFQMVWLALFGAVCAGLYRLGVRRVDLNGG